MPYIFMFPLALVPNAFGDSLHLRRRCFQRGYLLAKYTGPRSPEIYSKCKKLLHHITALHHVTRMHHFSWVGNTTTVPWTKFTQQISRYRKFPGGPMPSCTCREKCTFTCTCTCKCITNSDSRLCINSSDVHCQICSYWIYLSTCLLLF